LLEKIHILDTGIDIKAAVEQPHCRKGLFWQAGMARLARSKLPSAKVDGARSMTKMIYYHRLVDAAVFREISDSSPHGSAPPL